ncbi:MAG: CoA transferase subunit A [Deltaproteobacteria bacterium]|nr:CoA transferase subunit A [Deltaproteobacteria bacterium]
MNKVTTIEAAMEHVRDAQVIMFGGFMTVGTPVKLIDAILGKKIKDLTVVCNDAGVPGKGTGRLVAEEGVVKKYYASHVGLNPEFGKKMASGEIEAILVPQGTLAERIRAGGAGLGGFLTPTGVGTDVEDSERGKQKIVIEGRSYLLELPLRGDVACVKAHRADRAGNLIFRKSARNFNPLIATACDYVIAEVDNIECIGTLDPDMVHLPGIFVDAIIQG